LFSSIRLGLDRAILVKNKSCRGLLRRFRKFWGSLRNRICNRNRS